MSSAVDVRAGDESDPSRGPKQAGEHAEDLAFVARARTGGREAVDRFAERMRVLPRVLASKNRRLGAPLDADDLADLAQETFAIVWQKLGDYEARASLETWAVRIALLQYANALRRKHGSVRRQTVDVSDDVSLEVSESPQPDEVECDGDRVLAALTRLELDKARVIEMHQLGELSFAEIAVRLGEPLGTIKNRYYRGLERLRTLLRPHREKGLL